MKYVNVLVEGQTEETFVNAVLTPFLESKGIFLTPTVVKTKRVKHGPDFKGGITSYAKVKFDVRELLRNTSNVLVTTMLDYYGLPEDFPRYNQRPVGTCFERAAFLEQAFKADIDHQKFLPYLALHEFEAMMFAAPQEIANAFPDRDIAAPLQKIRAAYATPEEINEDDPPSKRILEIAPMYQKTLYGPLVTLEIGLERIRQACAHFNTWLQQLEALADR